MCIPNRSKEQNLSHERLTELLHYNPETGVFTWKVKKQKIRLGGEAGCVHKKGYVDVTIDGIKFKAHRLAWLYVHREWPNLVDHINRNRSDNRISNLRSVTQSENLKNTKIYTNNSSGHIGISLHKGSSRWQVLIRHEGVQKHLGYFDDIDDAIKARKAAELEYGYHKNHGIDPVVNFALAS